MPASTAYRLTVYRHHMLTLIRLVVSCREVRLTPGRDSVVRRNLTLKRLAVLRTVRKESGDD
jgi:hypothetical protein